MTRAESIAQKERRRREHLQTLKELKGRTYRYLKHHNPTVQSDLVDKLPIGKINGHRWIEELVSSYPEIFGRARLRMGATSGGRRTFHSSQLFNGLSVSHKSTPFIYLKDDDKTVGFFGQRLPKPSSIGHLHSLSYRLRREFGNELAEKILYYVRHR